MRRATLFPKSQSPLPPAAPPPRPTIIWRLTTRVFPRIWRSMSASYKSSMSRVLLYCTVESPTGANHYAFRLTKGRKKRPVPQDWATSDEVAALQPVASTDLAVSQATSLDIHSEY